jgi:serine/threonine protein kinase
MAHRRRREGAAGAGAGVGVHAGAGPRAGRRRGGIGTVLSRSSRSSAARSCGGASAERSVAAICRLSKVRRDSGDDSTSTTMSSFPSPDASEAGARTSVSASKSSGFASSEPEAVEPPGPRREGGAQVRARPRRGVVYIVMELLEGRDLRAELAARGPLPETEVVSHVLGACDALEEAHALGIVHRDLKPHNLFLSKPRQGSPTVKVLDFGMSKVDPALFDTVPLTRPETTLGTPRYMAPEQWQSAADVDARADIWALGAVMYELLTGTAPLQSLPAHERQARLLAGAIPSPRELKPDLSEGIARVILRCLRADRAGRWPSEAHLATALRDLHPEVEPRAERADVTRTGVTAVVPPAEQARRAAMAFAPEPQGPSTMPEPPTRPEVPAAHRLARAAMTSPMPPLPSSRSMRYLPSMVSPTRTGA